MDELVRSAVRLALEVYTEPNFQEWGNHYLAGLPHERIKVGFPPVPVGGVRTAEDWSAICAQHASLAVLMLSHGDQQSAETMAAIAAWARDRI